MGTAHELKILLQKYKEGNCTAEEEKLLRDWFICIGQDASPVSLSVEDQQRMLQDFTRSSRFSVPETAKRRYLKNWRAVAAAAILLSVILMGGWWAANRVNSFSPFTKEEVTFVQIETGRGQIKKILLPDSSIVWLNAHTQLFYHPDFTRHREIRLSGEALFEVAADEKHPFTVWTADSLKTTVLGTQFNIRSYNRLQETRITVISGRIQVTPPHMSGAVGILTRNQAFHFDRVSQSYIQVAVNGVAAAGWSRGEWALKDQGIAALALLLYNQYGITLINRRPGLDTLQLDINFTKQQGVKEMMTVFCLLANCQYQWKDSTTLELY
ncbi:FecR family protein [Chitinophaga nivalis]|uniref:FecR domain-containing protein n=1 Tax=Chitinophaga nivalis TaxID=2991709 RepID=A0ABT3IFF6_9BACT|nr:FecR domain-containing protein [Chitinophaga nivalis]MCW3467620.1 FecR domain-containing protein [Chitinophaga nivalis]MCW3482688.1 FecR domain-containing protein [Chitinophaga nivalis]